MRTGVRLPFVLILGLSVVGSTAQADPAINAWAISCEKLKQTLRANGSLIIHFRSARTKQPLYGRYVSDGRFCDSRETVTFARVPSADVKACPVKKCEQVY